jgi:hypothetical protein
MSDMRMEWWNDFRQRGVEDVRKLGGMITA